MARRSTKTPELPPPKNWTLAEIDHGIAKLRRRITDVEALAAEDITHSDPRVSPLESEIAANIEDIFGTGSREHKYHQHFSLAYYGVTQRAAFGEPDFYVEQRRKGYFKQGVKQGLETLAGLVKRLQEIREEFSKCPKCNIPWRLMDFCQNCGTALVALSWDPEAPTLRTGQDQTGSSNEDDNG